MKKELDKLKQYMFEKLTKELPTGLYYHSVNHVADVLEAAMMLADKEAITNYDRELLATAVIFHDVGFIKQSKNHEEKGCEIVGEILPTWGYSLQEIDMICGMIKATKIPQSPKNKLEEIICDADLDYLGRNDFWEIGKFLYREITEAGDEMSINKWNQIQVSFLESHNYFTQTAKNLRGQVKQIHLQQLKEMIKQ